MYILTLRVTLRARAPVETPKLANKMDGDWYTRAFVKVKKEQNQSVGNSG